MPIRDDLKNQELYLKAWKELTDTLEKIVSLSFSEAFELLHGHNLLVDDESRFFDFETDHIIATLVYKAKKDEFVRIGEGIDVYDDGYLVTMFGSFDELVDKVFGSTILNYLMVSCLPKEDYDLLCEFMKKRDLGPYMVTEQMIKIIEKRTALK